MYNICVVTGSRSEYGVLKRLLFCLKNDPRVKLTLVVTGSHLSNDYGYTKKEIDEDGFNNYIEIPILEGDVSDMGMIIGKTISKFSLFFMDNLTDFLVVIGDRYEILGVTIAAYMQKIPIGHISGGDVTEGALDDAIRHSITKMSYLHFPGCEESRKRIIQMGEAPDRVFNVGELGVENCLFTELLSRSELASELGADFILQDYAVVTYHPVTMEKESYIGQMHELIEAMNNVPDLAYLITMSNADEGGSIINDIWKKEASKHSNWLLVASLGSLKYLSAVKWSKVVIGNSSSGILEVPSMGIPTVNIGDRQKGRKQVSSIIQVGINGDDIKDGIFKATDKHFGDSCKGIKSFYDGGETSKHICSTILDFLDGGSINLEKGFYDVKFEQ